MRCSDAPALNMLAHQPPLNHSLLSGLLPVGERVSAPYEWSALPMSPVAAAAGATPADGTSGSTANAADKAIRRERIRRPYSRAASVSISRPHSLWLAFRRGLRAAGRLPPVIRAARLVQRSVGGERRRKCPCHR